MARRATTEIATEKVAPPGSFGKERAAQGALGHSCVLCVNKNCGSKTDLLFYPVFLPRFSVSIVVRARRELVLVSVSIVVRARRELVLVATAPQAKGTVFAQKRP